MTKITFYSILLLGILAAGACKKKNTDEVTPQTQSLTNTSGEDLKETQNEYYPLAVGNFWVYELKVCNLGVKGPALKRDSVVVSDKIIKNGLTYYKLDEYRDGQTTPKFSINVCPVKTGLVSEDGNLYFKSLDLTTAFSDTVYSPTGPYYYHYSSKAATIPVTVTAGTFNECIDYLGAEITLPKDIYPDNKRYIYNYYAKGVGFIMKWCPLAFNQESGELRELVNYHIE